MEARAAAPASGTRVYLPLLRTTGQAARRIEVALDTQAQVSGAIGSAGGTLRATGADGTGYEPVVPPQALDFTETITLTPVLRIDGLPLSGGLLGAVSLEPEGLQLYAPAQLRITPVRTSAGLPAVGFGYRGTGAQFHLRPLAAPPAAPQQLAAEPEITTELIAIRPVGAGRGTQAEIDQQQAIPPTDPLDAAAQQVADP